MDSMFETAPGKRGQRIWIVRHGERQDIIDPEWAKTAKRPFDPPLSAHGFVQAEQLAKRMAGESIDHLIVSPFLRTLQTAMPTSRALGLPLKVEYGAGEHIDHKWGYDPREKCVLKLREKFPEVDVSYTTCNDPLYPENWDLCRERGIDTSRKLLKKFYGQNIMVVAHAASVSGLTWGVVKGYPQLTGRLTGVVCAEHDGNGWQLVLGGCVKHLDDVGFDPARPETSFKAPAEVKR